MERVVQILQNSHFYDDESENDLSKDIVTNPLIHFRKLLELRKLMLAITNKEKTPILIGEKLIDFQNLFAEEAFFE